MVKTRAKIAKDRMVIIVVKLDIYKKSEKNGQFPMLPHVLLIVILAS